MLLVIALFVHHSYSIVLCDIGLPSASDGNINSSDRLRIQVNTIAYTHNKEPISGNDSNDWQNRYILPHTALADLEKDITDVCFTESQVDFKMITDFITEYTKNMIDLIL